MSEYQLQIKQVVDYPRCRIYRQFVQSLITDQGIRTGGGSGLFYFTVLCSYANFRTSYRRIDGISYTVYPGEWICTVKELAGWFRTHFQHQALDTQGVSCFRCPKPDISYILYLTTGRESIYAAHTGYRAGALGWRSAAEMADRFIHLS